MIFVEMIELEQHLSGIFKQTLNSIEMIFENSCLPEREEKRLEF